MPRALSSVVVAVWAPWLLVAQPPSWSSRTLAPRTVSSTEVTYDPVRDRIVAYVGAPGQEAVWEWNGGWVSRQPSTMPIDRVGSALAADAVGNVLLFGGSDGSGTPNAELWSFDGVDWTLLDDGGGPSPRLVHRMAYDAARGELMVFGGSAPSTSGYNAETWLWDGSSWRQAPAPMAPTRRAGSVALAYDPLRQVIVLHNGVDATTWEWDGVVWSARTTSGGPTQINPGLAMAWDPTTATIVLFETKSSTPTQAWSWDGSQWAALPPAPGSRWLVSTRSGLLAHATEGHVASWDGTRWQLVLRRPFVSNLTYDARRRQSIAVGIGSAWSWNGIEWVQDSAPSPFGVFTRLSPMWNDRLRQLWVVTAREFAPWTGDTYSYDGAAWRRLGGAPGYVEPGLAHEPSGAAILFGGYRVRAVSSYNVTTNYGETWRWDDGQWGLAASQGPSPRSAAAMAFHPQRGTIMLHGGATYGSPGVVQPSVPLQWFDDTWEWDGDGWTLLQNNGPTQERTELHWDADRDEMLLVGSAVWRWSTSGWQPVSTPPVGPGIAAYDSFRKRLIIERYPTTQVMTRLPIATVARRGAGCMSTSAQPLLESFGKPHLGNRSFGFDVFRGSSQSAAAILISTAPLQLTLAGGCQLLIDPGALATSLPAVTGTSGFATMPLPIPEPAALGGIQLHTQAVVLDPTAVQGFLTTIAVDLTIGL